MKTLIVEDETINRELLTEIVSEYGPTESAANGKEALSLFQEATTQGAPFDLICLDIMMPGLDGQQTLEKIRQLEAHEGLANGERAKIIMITALADSENIRKAYMVGGCQAYMVKPITLKKLDATLAELGLRS